MLDVDKFDDYAQSDYDALYKQAKMMEPSMSNTIDAINAILPPQYGEVSYLVSCIENGDKNARNRLVEAHLRMALRIAVHRVEIFEYLELSDTFEDACEGLVLAANKYNQKISEPFAAYASFWIRQVISRAQPVCRALFYYSAYAKEVVFSAYVLLKSYGCIGCETLYKCEEAKMVLYDITSGNDVPNWIIEALVPLMQLDILSGEDYCQFACDDMANEGLFQDDVKRSISDVLNKTLKCKEKFVVMRRFGFDGADPRTLEEIGDEMNLSRERVRQIADRALRNLRRKKHMAEMSKYMWFDICTF